MEETYNINSLRKNIFSVENFNLIEKEENSKLSLRKRYIDKFLENYRKKEILKKKSILEINVDKLNVGEEFRDFKLNDLVNF